MKYFSLVDGQLLHKMCAHSCQKTCMPQLHGRFTQKMPGPSGPSSLPSFAAVSLHLATVSHTMWSWCLSWLPSSWSRACLPVWSIHMEIRMTEIPLGASASQSEGKRTGISKANGSLAHPKQRSTRIKYPKWKLLWRVVDVLYSVTQPWMLQWLCFFCERHKG